MGDGYLNLSRAAAKKREARERARGQKIKGKFTLDGQPVKMPILFADNEQEPFTAAQVRAMKSLMRGEVLVFGGGAGAEFALRRVDGPARKGGPRADIYSASLAEGERPLLGGLSGFRWAR